MITTETVFIVGAGGSLPYGFPLGDALVKNILDNLIDPKLKNELIQAGFTKELIERLHYKLKGSHLKSIDAFLEYQDDQIKRLGKFAIAQDLLKNFRYDYLNHEDDWYKEVWSKMYSKPDLLLQNKISFVSFNYDLSLEHYLFRAVESSFDLTREKVADILSNLRIVHVHGRIGKAPWEEDYKNLIDIDTGSQGIKIISDEIGRDPEFEQAKRLIYSAERIYLMGFGYHEINIERLNLKSLAKNKFVKGNSFGLTNLQCSQIEKLMDVENVLATSHHWKNVVFFNEAVILT